MGILDRALQRMKPTEPALDADRALHELEAEDCVVSAVNDNLELAGPEEAVTRWTPTVQEHKREFRKALDRVPGFRKVDNPPLGERWIVGTVTDPDGRVRMQLVEPAPPRGEVVSEFETYLIGDDLWAEWTNEDGTTSCRRWR